MNVWLTLGLMVGFIYLACWINFKDEKEDNDYSDRLDRFKNGDKNWRGDDD